MPPRSLEYHVLFLRFSFHGLSCARPRMPFIPASYTQLSSVCSVCSARAVCCLGRYISSLYKTPAQGVVLPILFFRSWASFQPLLNSEFRGQDFRFLACAHKSTQKPHHGRRDCKSTGSTSRAYPRLDTSQPETKPRELGGRRRTSETPPSLRSLLYFPAPIEPSGERRG